MKSVTDQVLGNGALDRIVGEGITERDENLVRPEPVTGAEEPAAGPATIQQQQSRVADAKLRVAFATADRLHAPKPTGVHFVSGTNGVGLRQVQMIYDDGSVRNPYKAGRISGRQRRNMRKQANRNLRAQGMKTDLRLVFKGRQPDPEPRPLPATPATRTSDPLGDALSD